MNKKLTNEFGQYWRTSCDYQNRKDGSAFHQITCSPPVIKLSLSHLHLLPDEDSGHNLNEQKYPSEGVNKN